LGGGQALLRTARLGHHHLRCSLFSSESPADFTKRLEEILRNDYQTSGMFLVLEKSGVVRYFNATLLIFDRRPHLVRWLRTTTVGKAFIRSTKKILAIGFD
jgi:hypothetical protein